MILLKNRKEFKDHFPQECVVKLELTCKRLVPSILRLKIILLKKKIGYGQNSYLFLQIQNGLDVYRTFESCYGANG